MNSESTDPGMMFEGLVRYTFGNCGRRQDPRGIADQSCYNSRFVPEVNSKGVEALEYIIDGLIENKVKSESQKAELLELRASLSAMKQRQGIHLMQLIIKIMSEE